MRVTKNQASKAKVVKKAVKAPTSPVTATKPEPPTQQQPIDLSAVERSAAAMEDAVKQSRLAADQQTEELSKLIATLGMPTEPVRLKVHRDMERGSPTYMLIQYIDVVPVEAIPRKLNS